MDKAYLYGFRGKVDMSCSEHPFGTVVSDVKAQWPSAKVRYLSETDIEIVFDNEFIRDDACANEVHVFPFANLKKFEEIVRKCGYCKHYEKEECRRYPNAVEVTQNYFCGEFEELAKAT